MLVTYTGWGYYQYEVDTDSMNLTAEEKKERRFSGVCRERDEYVDRLIFELPKHLEQEIIVRGETVVDYLLFSEYGYYKNMCQNLKLPPKANTERFYLCEDEEPANNDSRIHERKRKQVRYTIAENKREVLNSIASIPDQQETVIDTKPKPTRTRNKRGQTQITIFLNELCRSIDDLSADKLVRAIKPKLGTTNCPVKKYHGFHKGVCVEWELGTGSRQGRWGKKAFQNFVSEFKKNNP